MQRRSGGPAFAASSPTAPRPRLQAASGSTAIPADSNAMDIPLPVTGGIMVMASPTQHSLRAAARCGSQRNSGHGAKRIFVEFRRRQPLIQRRTGLAAQPFAPVLRRLVFARPPPEQATNVHRAAIHPAQADIAPRRNVHFQVGGQCHISRVRLQAKPARAVFRRLHAPARARDDAFGLEFRL